MKVAIVAPEVAPFSKTGGLGDVAGALPGALAALGAEVLTISPLYRPVQKHAPESTPHQLQFSLGSLPSGVSVHRSGNHYFLEHRDYFDRDGLYGTSTGDFADNGARFLCLCRGALELLRALGAPDVIHAHDWQTGLIPMYVKTLYRDAFARTRTVFTIHNLAYQGVFGREMMPLTGLGWIHFNWKELEFHGNLNLMKAGLVYADALTTVSPGYAREIQTPEQGYGLEGVLRERSGALHGILNGIDTAEWDPSNDPHLAARYSAGAPAGKAACKAALQRRCGLPERPEVPLVGFVGRLSVQKGIDLLVGLLESMGGEDVHWVILGAGDEIYQKALRAAAVRRPDRVSAHVAFDAALAHQIEAGSDLFVMPSLYEPCGLNQLYSLRYGAVPVVRATGGLADTVHDGENGFTFGPYTVEAFAGALRRALEAFADRAVWRKVMAAGMSRDSSWEASARRYLWLYESLVQG